MAKENEKVRQRRPRRRINSAKIKTLFGLILILAAIVGIYYWETVGIKLATYETVVTFQEDTPAGTVVELEKLGTVNYPKDAIIEGAVRDYTKLLGKTTTSYIPKGAQLFMGNFEDTKTKLNEGEMIMQLPAGWVYAYPESVRSGDTISLYPVSTVALAFADDPVYEYQEDEYLFPEDWSEEQKKAYTKRTYPEVIESDPAPVIPKAEDTPVITCRVKYVKDASNREVVDASTKERYDGTDNISTFEIIVTAEQYQTLVQSRYDGNLFILSY